MRAYVHPCFRNARRAKQGCCRGLQGHADMICIIDCITPRAITYYDQLLRFMETVGLENCGWLRVIRFAGIFKLHT